MKRTISKRYRFGRVDFNGCGMNVNAVEVVIGLVCPKGRRESYLSIDGVMWNAIHSDTIMRGQCLDELRKFPSVAEDALFEEIYGLWRSWNAKLESEIPERPRSRILSLIQG